MVNKKDRMAGILGFIAKKSSKCAKDDKKIILICLDADKDCTADIAKLVRSYASFIPNDIRIEPIIFIREFEAFFCTAAFCARKKVLVSPKKLNRNAEDLSDAKGWITNNIQPDGIYSESVDQARLTSLLNLDDIEKFRVVRRIWSALE